MEVQALIERRDKLQDDIRDAVTSLVKDFEIETGINIRHLSINDTDIKVMHHHPWRTSAEIVAKKELEPQEIFFNTSIGLGI